MIEEYFTFVIEHINTAGFLNTRASLGIDIIVTFLAVALFVIAVILVLPVVALGMIQCDQLGNMHPDIEFQYRFWTGCRALFEGVWISSENLYLVVGGN